MNIPLRKKHVKYWIAIFVVGISIIILSFYF